MKLTFKKFNELKAEDICFDFQMHALQTDGADTAEAMIARALFTTAACAQVGFNTVEAAIRKVVLGEDLPFLKHKKGLILRYFNELFVPENEVKMLQEQKWIASPSSEVNHHF